jgi:hypothetical protein
MTMRRTILIACTSAACGPRTDPSDFGTDLTPTQQGPCVARTAGAVDEDVTVTGESVDPDGDPWAGSSGVYFELIEAAVWWGSVPNGEGFYTSVQSPDGRFTFEGVPPGTYVARGSAGTCNGGCEIEGEAGDLLDVAIEIYCNF